MSTADEIDVSETGASNNTSAAAAMTGATLIDFLSRVVPWPAPGAPGVVNIQLRMRHSQSGDLIWAGRPTHSVAEFVSQVNWALQRPANFTDIYYCMSLQARTGRVRDGRPSVARSQADALLLRSIWLDIDVKEPPKGYADLAEALKALDIFIKAYKLPFPTALIGSGGGLHVYWVSDKDLSPDEWRPYAEGLRTAAVQHGLRCDSGVTVDSARILRVPGTFNNKIAGRPRPVQVLHLEQTNLNFAQTLGHLAVMAPSNVVTATVTPAFDMSGFATGGMASAFAKALDPSESLAAGIEHNHDPLDPTAIFAKDGCPYFRDAFATHGKDAGQGLWMLTVLASTFWINGDTFAHELSNGHPGYKADETDAMIERKTREREQRGLGWPSCKSFENEGCTFCKDCPHNGQIKSPLNLAIHRTASRPASKPIVAAGANPVHELVTLHAQGLSLDDLLPEFNKRFAVVGQGQDVLVAKIAQDEVQTFTVPDFHRMFANLCLGNPDGKDLQVSQEWFRWRGRRQFFGRGVVFEPGAPLHVDNDCINLWRGFAIEPVPGDWSLMRKHIFHVICSGNQTHFDYLMGWHAYSVQNLGQPVGVAVALRGEQGAGKGILARTFGSLFGKHFAHVTNGEHLTGHFNSTVGKSLFVFLDEAIWAADKKGEGVLKALITEPKLQVEAKYRDPIMVENRLRIMVASNSDWFVPVGVTDRRWFVLDVANTYAGTGHAAYWEALYAEIKAGGGAAMFHDLLKMNLSGFDIRAVPRTTAKLEQQTRGLKGATAWLYSALQEGKIRCKTGRDLITENEWETDGLIVDKDHAYDGYCEFSKQQREHHPQEKSQWCKELRLLLPGCVTGSKRTTEAGRRPCFLFSSLNECRQAFATKTGLTGLDWEEFEGIAPMNATPSSALTSALAQAAADLALVRKAA